MALGRCQPKAGLLHRSGRGCQYASEACREHLATWKIAFTIRMDRVAGNFAGSQIDVFR